MLDAESPPRPATRPADEPSDQGSVFAIGTLAAVLLGAAIRILYVSTFPSTVIVRVAGDGFAYSIQAGHLADGLGYVAMNGETPSAHHPPGWVTVLGVMSRLGLRSVQQHQWVTVGIGLVLIVVVAFVARRLFGDVVGAVAAIMAAVYPGFWVIEGQVLAEPLALVTVGLVILSLYRFAEGPTTARALEVGVLAGLSALVRSETIAVVAIVLLVVLWRAQMPVAQKLLRAGTTALVVGVLLMPWALHNASRFEEPVLLSTNMGSTLLAGNCNTFEGELLGFYDTTCGRRLGNEHPDNDKSQMDALLRDQALENAGDNVSRLPVTVLARYGRTLGVYASTDTVGRVAEWQGVETWPVWMWVVSFWIVLPLAVVGMVVARRRGVWLLPLIAPIIVVVLVVTVFYGEPRYHTPADLSFVVLASYGLVALWRRWRAPAREGRT